MDKAIIFEPLCGPSAIIIPLHPVRHGIALSWYNDRVKTKVETTGAPKAAGPYSQAIVVGNMIFTAGQIHLTSDGKLIEGSIEEQTHQVMKNLQAVLEAAGVTFADVVKTTIYVTNMSVYGKINEVYGSYMSDPFPARETVAVKELPLGARVEISMVAIKT